MARRKNTKFGVFLVLIIAALLICAALVLFTDASAKRITAENREYLIDNAVQTAANIDSAISDGYDNIKILSALVSNSLTGPEFDITSIQSLINNSVFDFMEFADSEGMDHNITGGVSDARDRKYYLDAKAGNTGMELIYVSRATHETLLMFYSPIYYEGEFVGSLVGVYQASNKITQMLSAVYFGEPVTAYLATDEGRIIACSQGFDPNNEMYVTDLAEGDKSLENRFRAAVGTGARMSFSLAENSAGGCMLQLPENGWYLVQIFPHEASVKMIREANTLSYILVGFLLLLCVIILIALVHFYRFQQKQVELAKNQAESANMAKTNFLFNMSHDIRTPMNAIIGFNRMAMKNIDDREKVADCLTKSSKAGDMLLSLINSILDMSRIESGKAALDEKEANIYDSFDNIDVTMMELAKTKDIELKFAIGAITDRYVYVDYDRTTRIFTNVITNAIKYTHEGGHVNVTCEQIGGAKEGYGLYKYVVEDDGIGISEDFREHIFEEFAREENSTTSGIQGTGLGLSVVKSFVELMGGTIECTSNVGEGTVFTIILPFRLMEKTKDEEQDESENASDAPAGRTKGGRSEMNPVTARRQFFDGRKVLLCEDNELNREIAHDILEEQGIVVEDAENGQVAIDIMADKGPDYYDFILMDIQMPIVGGYEATRAIRAMYPEARIPIVALSANAFAEDKAASVEAGMDNHVAKSIHIERLFEVLTEIIKD